MGQHVEAKERSHALKRTHSRHLISSSRSKSKNQTDRARVSRRALKRHRSSSRSKKRNRCLGSGHGGGIPSASPCSPARQPSPSRHPRKRLRSCSPHSRGGRCSRSCNRPFPPRRNSRSCRSQSRQKRLCSRERSERNRAWGGNRSGFSQRENGTEKRSGFSQRENGTENRFANAPGGFDRGPDSQQVSKVGTVLDTCDKGKAKGKGRPPSAPAEKPDRFTEHLWEQPREQTGLKLIGELAPTVCWQYPIRDEPRRCYCAYLPSPFRQEQRASLFETVKKGCAWLQPEGRLGPIPRKTVWLVKNGCTCQYRYGNIEVDPVAFPPWMTDIMQAVIPLCGFENPESWPNSCNVNLYDDGDCSVGWHSDDERIFQTKFIDARIISLSLGAKRKFELRMNWPGEGERPLSTLFLGDGDLCTMEGMMQKHYQHRVPKEPNITSPRINLTWRWLVKHMPRCSAGRMGH